MNKYTFRIDVIPQVENIEERITLALQPFEKYLIAFEEAEKTKKYHYQGIVFSTWGHEKYKKYMESMFEEWKGTKQNKGKRSFAKVKKDEYEIYITKDGDFRFIKGYLADEVASLQEQSYQKPIASNPQVEKIKKKEKSWFHTLIDHCKSRGIHATSSGWEIAAAIIHAYSEYVKCEPNDFQIKCYAKSIQRELIKEQRPERFDAYMIARAKQVIGHEWTHDY